MHAPSWFQEVDHTGDTGIAVQAPDLTSLFERAAWAMFSVITNPDDVQPRETRKVEVEGTDLDDLLLRWLSELNFVHLVDHYLFARFEISEMTNMRLAATVRGEPIDARRHTVFTEIKAVTYHGLRIEQTGSGWSAQVIFDM